VSWEQELATAYRKVEDLARDGFISWDEASKISSIPQKYQLLLPRYYANLIDRNDPNCPIRLQSIPRFEENDSIEFGLLDPLQDLTHRPVQKITHRYHNRVLLHLTPNCSMYCRFCFRKSLLNELKNDLFSGDIGDSLQYLQEEKEVEEVIFSGGDPFMVSEGALQQVLNSLASITHIKRVRFHTRVPVTLPSRITSTFVDTLAGTRFKTVVVTHFNHPKELTQEAKVGLELLSKRVTLLNQSVFLKKVNDRADILIELSEKLFEAGVLPYYLHQLDSAQGTRHFYVEESLGRHIWDEMKKRLPGYLVPRYVVDIVGDPYKREVSGSV